MLKKVTPDFCYTYLHLISQPIQNYYLQNKNQMENIKIKIQVFQEKIMFNFETSCGELLCLL